jgi:hypothetical protein
MLKTIKAMLEYFKTILSRVSFDKSLFEKELSKAVKALVPEELREFKNWCYAQFGSVYQNVLNKYFLNAV